jgi:hypothetical protein
MPHLPHAQHETSKRDSPNETKVKEKQNKTIPNLNSNLAKSMTHHTQTKNGLLGFSNQEQTTWFFRFIMEVSEFHYKRMTQKPCPKVWSPIPTGIGHEMDD